MDEAAEVVCPLARDPRLIRGKVSANHRAWMGGMAHSEDMGAQTRGASWQQLSCSHPPGLRHETRGQ
jgi:hypothetical protein